jgi:hypothetical protein
MGLILKKYASHFLNCVHPHCMWVYGILESYWCRCCCLSVASRHALLTFLASAHLGKSVESICIVGSPTGRILLQPMRVTVSREDLELKIGFKQGEVLLYFIFSELYI